MAGKKGRKQKGSSGYNRKVTEEFLHKNRNKPGICETDSGLQYEIIDQTEEESPKLNHSVQVHQRITLLDGTIVDDTYKQNTPVEFTLKEAIEGYREGLMLMGAGSRFKFFIPPELAWGKRGAGSKIGPNSLLMIDVRLLGFF